MAQSEKKYVVIDGNSIVNRAFYGIRLLSNAEGVYTNALLGFFEYLRKTYGRRDAGWCLRLL